MKTVKQLLQTKGAAVWSIGPEAWVIDALKLLAEKEIGALVVVEAGQVVGILSERDYARKVSLQGKSSKTTRVGEIMTEKVVFVRPDQTVEDCMALMTSKRIRHLPVMDGDKLMGVISIGDVVKEVIAHQEFLIGQLENYITGQ
ncbi:MAG: CBS domain-containing protein [Anaerolineales bacterium]|nr:CBS domain-containing protein [Anaerolineales bacterium]